MYKKVKRLLNHYKYEKSKKRDRKFCEEINLLDIKNYFFNRNISYLYFHNYFWHKCPEDIRCHKEYFRIENRGFGEDAFHAMWYLIFREFRPQNILEIGIYRGQTLSLFSLLSHKFEIKSEIHGISPFTSVGDTVSTYLKELNYYEDVLKNFKHFGLELPALHKGLSTDKSMIKIIDSKTWDLIYIDGNHDYEVVKQDFINCSNSLSKNGLIVLDDAALYSDYKPCSFSSSGHPGPSKVAEEIDSNLFKEVIAVGHNRVFQKESYAS